MLGRKNDYPIGSIIYLLYITTLKPLLCATCIPLMYTCYYIQTAVVSHRMPRQLNQQWLKLYLCALVAVVVVVMGQEWEWTEPKIPWKKGYICTYIYIYRACLAGSKEFGVCFFGYFCSISVLLLASCKGGKELARQTSSRVEQSNTSSKPAESSSTFLWNSFNLLSSTIHMNKHEYIQNYKHQAF